MFEDTRRSGEPREFTLGRHQAAAGLEEAVRGMQAGGRYAVIVPRGCNTDPEKLPAVARNETLAYEAELLEVKEQDALDAMTSALGYAGGGSGDSGTGAAGDGQAARRAPPKLGRIRF